MLARATAPPVGPVVGRVPARLSLPRPPRAIPAVHQVLSDIAAVGDVDAPIGVVVGGAILVTLIGTAIIPLALSPGQEAASKIFSGKQRAPIDEGKKGKKAPPAKRR